MSHGSARLTVHGRLLIVQRHQQGWRRPTSPHPPNPTYPTHHPPTPPYRPWVSGRSDAQPLFAPAPQAHYYQWSM